VIFNHFIASINVRNNWLHLTNTFSGKCYLLRRDSPLSWQRRRVYLSEELSISLITTLWRRFSRAHATAIIYPPCAECRRRPACLKTLCRCPIKTDEPTSSNNVSWTNRRYNSLFKSTSFYSIRHRSIRNCSDVAFINLHLSSTEPLVPFDKPHTIYP